VNKELILATHIFSSIEKCRMPFNSNSSPREIDFYPEEKIILRKKCTTLREMSSVYWRKEFFLRRKQLFSRGNQPFSGETKNSPGEKRWYKEEINFSPDEPVSFPEEHGGYQNKMACDVG
jgi:hypothetical protein